MVKASTCSRAFTMAEILIVIAIVVLVIALAVPALSLMTGSGSINGAENNIAAALGRARADAIGVQEIRGVLFFIDPDTQRVTMAEVRQASPPAAVAPGVEVYLDLIPDQDFTLLPKGVGLQTVDNAVMDTADPTVRMDDAYIGFNTSPPAVDKNAAIMLYGGVILFDDKGQITGRTYRFRGGKVDATGTTVATDMSRLLRTGKITGDTTDVTDFVTTAIPRSQYGMVLFDGSAFDANWSAGDSQVDATGTPPQRPGPYTDSNTAASRSPEANEERWLDENSTPLMVNRYNGTLIRGE